MMSKPAEASGLPYKSYMSCDFGLFVLVFLAGSIWIALAVIDNDPNGVSAPFGLRGMHRFFMENLGWVPRELALAILLPMFAITILCLGGFAFTFLLCRPLLILSRDGLEDRFLGLFGQRLRWHQIRWLHPSANSLWIGFTDSGPKKWGWARVGADRSVLVHTKMTTFEPSAFAAAVAEAGHEELLR